MANDENLHADMTKLQPQYEEDQLTPPSRASLDAECLVPKEPDQSALSYAEGVKYESRTDNRSQSTITVLAIAFMEGVKAEFGAQSRETSSIVEVLRTFGGGTVTKRETLSNILETIQGREQLEHSLMVVLNQPESQWDRDDFDTLPLQQPGPHFLQPAHEPKMRLPGFTSSWKLDGERLLSAADTALLSGFDQDNATETEKFTFPTRVEQDRWSQPARSMVSSPRVSKSIDDVFSSQRNEIQSWPVTDQTASMDHLQLPFHGGPQHTSTIPFWQDSGRIPRLGEDRSNQLFAHETLLDHPQLAWSGAPIDALGDPSLLRRSESVTALSQHQLAPSRLPGSILAPDPLDMYTENRDLAMLPPSRKRSHYAENLQPHVRGQHMSGGEVQQAEINPEQATYDASPPKPSSKRSRVEGSGPYIHALCGKGFGSRYKVRKHHWGNEMDNITTTTGCWYKHKKPDCNWDDHPSCKEQPKAPTLVRQKAGPAPRQQRNSTSAGIRPKLEHVPHDLATSPEPHTTGEQHDNNPDAPDSFTNEAMRHSTYLPYHTHTLPPSSSPFESLLTAVNFAAEIESPMPQRRNDSVVASKLNAHAIASELTEEYTTNWEYNQATRSPGNNVDYFGPQPPHLNDISLSMGNRSMTNSMRRNMPQSLHTHSGDHMFSTHLEPAATYRHSYLNSRNPIVWSPSARPINEYNSTFSMQPREDGAG